MGHKKRLLVHLHRPVIKKLSALHGSMRVIKDTTIPEAQLEALKIVIDSMYFNINGICERLDDFAHAEGIRTMDIITKLRDRLSLLNVQMVPRERPKAVSLEDHVNTLFQGLPSILNVLPSPMAAHNGDAFMDAIRKAADQMLADTFSGGLKPITHYLENIFAKGGMVNGTPSKTVGESGPEIKASPKVGEPIKGKLTCMAMERLKAGLEQKQSEMVNSDNKSGYEAIQAILEVLDKTF